jgi:GrpB-like predicted nucleotidyltransferase (UPF0157 family)
LIDHLLRNPPFFGSDAVLIMYIMFHSLSSRLETHTERAFTAVNFDGVLSSIRRFCRKNIRWQISRPLIRAFEMSASKIKISPHSKNWKLEFQNLAATIRNLVGDTATRIDHIGSTAVEGLCAKDKIDIQITVASAADFALLKEKLESGGFVHASENSFDHIPAGCQLDESHWQKQFYRAPEGFRAMNLHVRVSGKENQKYPLLFRDFLRSDKVAAEHYGKVKQQLALHCDGIEAYCDVKDPVCDLIMLSAQSWATAKGWHLPESDA